MGQNELTPAGQPMVIVGKAATGEASTTSASAKPRKWRYACSEHADHVAPGGKVGFSQGGAEFHAQRCTGTLTAFDPAAEAE